MADQTYPVSEHWLEEGFVNNAQYLEMYQRSIDDPDGFWGEVARAQIDWIKPFTKVNESSFDPVSIKWFADGTLNMAANCIDRHLEKRGDQVAIYWEPDTPGPERAITYKQLHSEVSKFSNVLKSLGVKKGDPVSIYMPMIPEAVFAMLACARIGAVHSVVFGGFSPEALSGRINDCQARVLITADEGLRGGKPVPLKANCDQAVANAPSIEHVIVVQHSGGQIDWNAPDKWWHELVDAASDDCPPEEMGAEDPLFILYTSGSTGTPKGVVHTTGGYAVYVSYSHKMILNYREGDIPWSAADVGWIVGHSYATYAPLLNGSTTLLYEGLPNYPDASRMWQIVDKFGVTQLFTAPTAIRSLMGAGDEFLNRTSRKSLRLLATAGEPINPEAWHWYYDKVGQGRCPIMDNWWQTETGAAMLTPLAGATALKPGSATRPFFGIKPELVDSDGNVMEGAAEGNLVIAQSWPGQMRTIYGDEERFKVTYFADYKGKYFTSDGCRRDEDGYYWITGRVDDVINVSGHRMGTAEIESALVAHRDVAEAAVVGFAHAIKGQGIYVYVSLMAGKEPSEALRKELIGWVRKEIGPIATPDVLQFAPDLPKTRSGKIMRRILRKIAENDFDNLGDVSTLADPSVVEALIANRVG